MKKGKKLEAVRSKTIMDYYEEHGEESGVVTYLVTTPPIEEIKQQLSIMSEIGTELTITYKPDIHDRYTPATLTQMSRDNLFKIQKRHPELRAILIGEYSKTGMYHMHGTLKCDPRTLNALKRRLSHELGRCEIKSIKYVDSWVDYVLKKSDDDRINTKEILREEFIYM